VVTLGPSTACHILYDADGVLTGGVKVTNPLAVGRVTRLIRPLYAEGEDLTTFRSGGVTAKTSGTYHSAWRPEYIRCRP
jgi:hypothetical protein